MSEIETNLQPEHTIAHQFSRRDFLKLMAAAGLVAGGSTCQRTLLSDESSTPSSKFDFRQISFCGIYCQEVCPENAYPN